MATAAAAIAPPATAAPISSPPERLELPVRMLPAMEGSFLVIQASSNTKTRTYRYPFSTSPMAARPCPPDAAAVAFCETVFSRPEMMVFALFSTNPIQISSTNNRRPTEMAYFRYPSACCTVHRLPAKPSITTPTDPTMATSMLMARYCARPLLLPFSETRQWRPDTARVHGTPKAWHRKTRSSVHRWRRYAERKAVGVSARLVVLGARHRIGIRRIFRSLPFPPGGNLGAAQAPPGAVRPTLPTAKHIVGSPLLDSPRSASPGIESGVRSTVLFGIKFLIGG